MKIYSMTATFGKLEHDTLTLRPGLTVVQAPNEWGKSTWCAFLMAMFYGLDTRAKSTKTALANKERFAPWSGSPMAGRIDLNWQGRDITIERHTRRRIPLGEFRAYETVTGLPVPELTAANCGEMLLGTEQSVYRRSGFIRFSDLPVTQDEALTQRLNALVTTGDESGNAQRLDRALRDLKNRCRYNKTGLLPQAEEERAALRQRLAEFDNLSDRSAQLQQRLQHLEQEEQALENHLTALEHAAAREDEARVKKARSDWHQQLLILDQLKRDTAVLPPRDAAEEKLEQLKNFSREWNALREEHNLLPEKPEEPVLPPPFQTADPEETLRRDTARWNKLKKNPAPVFFLGAAAAILAACVFGALKIPVGALCALGVGLLALIPGFGITVRVRKERRALEEKYASTNPLLWEKALEAARLEREAYLQRLALYNRGYTGLKQRTQQLLTRRAELCGEDSPAGAAEYWQGILSQWDALEAARREEERTRSHLEALSAMLRPAPLPVREDTLTCSREDTHNALSGNRAEQSRLRGLLGQYQGRMLSLGEREELLQQLARLDDRIARLEDTYAALTIAQETLLQARQELQRRFAPRITRRARELMEAMTDGRYDRLTMDEALSLHTATKEEDTQRSLLYRSDGTVDQLYLALRLAVAQELIPDAPLILDDALVRFDDDRAKAALEILKSMAKTRQIILFTCQGREKALL